MIYLILILLFKQQAFSYELVMDKDIIDIHTNIRCYDQHSKCYTKKNFDNRLFSYLSEFSREILEKKGDSYLFKEIHQQIQDSRWTKKTTILAFDQVYDSNGIVNKEKTSFFVPNSFVQKETDKYNTLLFGASLHPYRKDLELNFSKIKGAKLLYIDPVLQRFDLTDPRLIAFAKMAYNNNIPLMIKVPKDTKKIFKNILETKVTLILTGSWMDGGETGFEQFEYFTGLVKQYQNLYASIAEYPKTFSWIKHLTKANYNMSWNGRLLYASNYPYNHPIFNSVWYYPQFWGTPATRILESLKINRWDYQATFKKQFTTPIDVFIKSKNVLISQ